MQGQLKKHSPKNRSRLSKICEMVAEFAPYIACFLSTRFTSEKGYCIYERSWYAVKVNTCCQNIAVIANKLAIGKLLELIFAGSRLWLGTMMYVDWRSWFCTGLAWCDDIICTHHKFLLIHTMYSWQGCVRFEHFHYQLLLRQFSNHCNACPCPCPR